jgi:hypothetical protein
MLKEPFVQRSHACPNAPEVSTTSKLTIEMQKFDLWRVDCLIR